MSELVEQDGAEEQRGGDQTLRPVGGRRLRREHVREVSGGQAPRDETEDEEPAEIGAHGDPPHAEDLHHRRTRASSSAPSPGMNPAALPPLTSPMRWPFASAVSRNPPPAGSCSQTPSFSYRPDSRAVRRSRPTPDTTTPIRLPGSLPRARTASIGIGCRPSAGCQLPRQTPVTGAGATAVPTAGEAAGVAPPPPRARSNSSIDSIMAVC